MRALYRILFSPAPETYSAHALSIALVDEARNPFFYTQAQVPDTLDGRFDMQVLLLFLALERVKHEPNNGPFVQALLECFFSTLDRSLREMGVGDMGVGRRIRKMANATNGRLQRYGTDWADKREAAITDNLYRGDAERATKGLPQLLPALDAIAARLAQSSLESLKEGRIAA